jgi:hypothetical protein
MAKRQLPVAGVTIEWEGAKHARLNAKDGPRDKTKIPHSKNKDDEFTPTRIIIDLKLDLGDASVERTVELGGIQQKVVDLIDVHLKIPYHQGKKSTLGWWNGAKWVKFKDVTYDDQNSVADVILPSPWPTDPAIGGNP